MTPTIELGQLNVLIGPNAVGKSNLIEAIGLLQAVPASLEAAILRGGGVRQWLWLGDSVPPIAAIECELTLTRGRQVGPLRYELQFSADAYGLVIVDERLAPGVGDVPGQKNGGTAALAGIHGKSKRRRSESDPHDYRRS